MLKNDSVNILHLSDLHFGVEKYSKSDPNVVLSQRKDLFKQLIKTINNPKKVPIKWRPDIIVISGDIAFSGSRDEYEQFETDLFDELCTLLGESVDKSRIIICPGNHDIIREMANGESGVPNERPYKDDYNIPPNVPNLDLALATDAVKGKWHHFEDYVDKCCGNDPSNLCRTVTFPEWPWLHFLVLNSAWDCRDNDDVGRLRVGADIAYALHAQTITSSEKDTFIAVFHHPLMSVSDVDKDGNSVYRHWLHCSELYKSDGTGTPNFGSFIVHTMDIVLNGHVHTQMDPIKLGLSYHFINGTIHSNDVKLYNCRIIRISKYRSTEYIDLSRKLSDQGVMWTVTVPKDVSEWDRNAWECNVMKLLADLASSIDNDNECERIITALVRLLINGGMEENTYDYSFNEKSKDLVRVLKP